MPRRPFALLLLFVLALVPPSRGADDPIKAMQDRAIAAKDQKQERPYHFGPQGRGGVYSASTSHSNRLIPIYTFGRKLDLGAVTGKNSRYRTEAGLKALFRGQVPPHTLNPDAEYCDQSDLYRVQRAAVDAGVKYLFIAWFDGMDWEATRAAAIAKSGRVYEEGKGAGLVFQDYDAGGSARFGWYVTTPTHDRNTRNPDDQTVKVAADALPGGYDPEIAGAAPWARGRLFDQFPSYLMGSAAKAEQKKAIRDAGRTLHAVTDSAPSAAEFASGVKSYNDGVNVDEDGRFVPTLFQQLQAQGWAVGTATSVPFNHASPSAMYAHNVERDDYQDLARDMLGLKSIGQELGKDQPHPGLDVVLGAGYGQVKPDDQLKAQGKNAARGQNTYLADADLKAANVDNGGPYVVVTTKPNVNGARSLAAAADRAAKDGRRLFGFYGTNVAHLPYRTADGNYDPANGIKGTAETYSAADRDENPTLADMARAAIQVLSAKPGRPFALFVEAGDVDFALHDNNLDNAIGAVHSGDEAVREIIAWVEKHSNWDESALIVTADHGHYLVIDDPQALARPASGARAAR